MLDRRRKDCLRFIQVAASTGMRSIVDPSLVNAVVRDQRVARLFI
jgi:hypothetical protein